MPRIRYCRNVSLVTGCLKHTALGTSAPLPPRAPQDPSDPHSPLQVLPLQEPVKIHAVPVVSKGVPTQVLVQGAVGGHGTVSITHSPQGARPRAGHSPQAAAEQVLAGALLQVLQAAAGVGLPHLGQEIRGLPGGADGCAPHPAASPSQPTRRPAGGGCHQDAQREGTWLLGQQGTPRTLLLPSHSHPVLLQLPGGTKPPGTHLLLEEPADDLFPHLLPLLIWGELIIRLGCAGEEGAAGSALCPHTSTNRVVRGHVGHFGRFVPQLKPCGNGISLAAFGGCWAGEPHPAAQPRDAPAGHRDGVVSAPRSPRCRCTSSSRNPGALRTPRQPHPGQTRLHVPVPSSAGGITRVPHHGVQEADAALELRPRLAELPEEQPADGLLLAQVAIVLLCKGRWDVPRDTPSVCRSPVPTVSPSRDPGAGPAASQRPPRLTQALAQLIALADVREPQDLPPLLAPAFPLAAASCSSGRRGQVSRTGGAAPARWRWDNGAPEPQPSAAESPGLGFPPIPLLLVPKTHRSHTYPPPPALGLWAALKPWVKTHPERGEGSEPPRDHCPR